MAGYYDFGSGMPLPPTQYHYEYKEDPYFDSRAANFNRGPPFRSFARCADLELLDYLRARNVSPAFLIEIDKFLESHSEIARYQPEWVERINFQRPLDAYLFFVKGYTRPARYTDGVLPSFANFPLDFNPVPLTHKRDPELIEFFNGFEYRSDILHKIDHEVSQLQHRLHHGDRVGHSERKLVVLTLYGNLVDAFKFYEYCFQTDWLPHRYLGEHVVLTELPKPAGEEPPLPRQLASSDEDCYEHMRSHPGTRARMARACDAGVDVIEVLLDDFTAALCRQGFRRNDIERMRKQACSTINHEREVGSGRDIVDLIMDQVNQTQPCYKPSVKTNKRAKRITTIEGLKHSLRRLQRQEASLDYDADFVRAGVTALRQRAERELIMELTILAKAAGVMGNNDARWLSHMFARKRQEERERSGQYIDVFEMMAQYM